MEFYAHEPQYKHTQTSRKCFDLPRIDPLRDSNIYAAKICALVSVWLSVPTRQSYFHVYNLHAQNFFYSPVALLGAHHIHTRQEIWSSLIKEFTQKQVECK